MCRRFLGLRYCTSAEKSSPAVLCDCFGEMWDCRGGREKATGRGCQAKASGASWGAAPGTSGIWPDWVSVPQQLYIFSSAFCSPLAARPMHDPFQQGKILLKGCLATKPSLVWLRFAQKQCKQPVNFHCCPLTPNQKHTVLIPVSCTCHPFRGISIIWGFWCLWPVNQRVLPLLARHFNKLLGSLCVRERIEKQPVFFAFWIPLTASGKCVIFLNTLLFNLLLLLCLI